MNPDSLKATKVGLLVVAFVVAAYGVFHYVDEQGSGGDGYQVWAAFDDVQGLVSKSRVLIAGIQVGQIDEIKLWKGKARVTLRINSDVKLHEDGWIAKRSTSILGESVLVIFPGTAIAPVLKDGAELEVNDEGGGTDAIMRNVGAISVSIRKVSEQLEHAFGNDEAGTQMKDALRNLTEAIESANRTIQTNENVIGRTLSNVEGITDDAAPKLARILSNVEDVTARAKAYMGQTDGEGSGDANVADTIASINHAAHQLEEVLADVKEVTGRTAEGKGTVGRLTKDETLVNEVEGVVEGVNDFVGGFSRLQTIVGLRSEYNFLANAFKSYFQLRIQPREDRYYLFELINDPRGATRFVQSTVRTNPPIDGIPQTYTETREVTEDAFRFSLMFAKRVHFATFRFGILESTGGIGVDLHLVNDRLEVTTDLYAIGEQANPRLRTRLAFELVRRLWIVGGLDDYLNDTRDVFMGAQLKFNDEDLKIILPFAALPN